MSAPMPAHAWRFFAAGGFDQVSLDSGTDLVHLDKLDQKLWVALSCPVRGLEFDPRTLALIDTDGDGHIRAPELIAAAQWAAGRLKSSELLGSGGALPLDKIADEALLVSARHILESLGKPDAASLEVEDASDSLRIFAGKPFNGDGVITAACSESLAPALADIVACLGGKEDRSGEPGIDQEIADRFFAEARAWVDWQAQREAPEIMPLGAETEAAHAALAAVRTKIDDYFARCRLAAYDPRGGDLLNASDDDLRALGAKPLAEGGGDMGALPIAWVKAEAILPLVSGLNPAWSDAVAALRETVVRPLLGERDHLTTADWAALTARFTPYEIWLAERPETPVATLEAPRLQELLDPAVQEEINTLLAEDSALAPEADAIADVERLARYVRDFNRLANNFVAFRDFYSGRDKATFQAGTLYLDGRSCDLCLKVLDADKHAALATLSGICLAYCHCVRGAETMTIAAALTAGDSDQLMVGRNGVFYDREGRDWDATITKLVDHPISIRQAFWSPYKKVARLIGEQFQKFAAAKAKASDEASAKAVADPAKPAPAPFDAAKFAGIFAAIGLAIGALGTALAAVVTGFLGLKAWQMPLALAGLVLLISGPSMALAYFKLRNRNLAPLLDANGWAVNARARINIPFGTALTQLATLPPGAERTRRDPYAEPPVRWNLWLYAGLGVLLGALLYFISTGAIKGG